ncbi:ribonuclease P protein component [Candidatus Woesebacteria bacterium RIFCSPHIGHO2_01_FULL_44_10]|uniref:Ribonuclease P protein component n=1 Tax=Candidatus Woesebacteria bacterium RIFCSPLOWO2_01_FULL_44_14 TaxID=1802525 RepID=A0A1F8C166_9BACT|nr:MAG: ribonuclease P protein component [Candidatus Woesebacteria bacterium RIFCSPHIGHO2_01_FULL_44_10]OGM53717.1 MAG: ribonuclease P protein component [Candidatus Woesebacteria bacterium RIFCSPHIGHO2_12_FULL_44_11]OGM70063.1 MAG: ribonuclease P protein component [Candidatus Woesebacteria bacterium RIFCSPLOWO2_01_FULL_44_14]
MLARPYRITKEEEFERVKKKGKAYNHPFFTFLVYNRRDKKPSRFGFVISKKISGLATARNKIKRALRDAIRRNLSQIKPGYDVVVLTKGEIARKYTSEIMQEVDAFLKHVSLTN